MPEYQDTFQLRSSCDPEEVRAASLQFVRKISGFNKPSKANETAFLAAVDDIAAISTRLLRSLETNAAPRTGKKKPPKQRPAPQKDSPPESVLGKARGHGNSRLMVFSDSPVSLQSMTDLPTQIPPGHPRLAAVGAGAVIFLGARFLIDFFGSAVPYAMPDKNPAPLDSEEFVQFLSLVTDGTRRHSRITRLKNGVEFYPAYLAIHPPGEVRHQPRILRILRRPGRR